MAGVASVVDVAPGLADCADLVWPCLAVVSLIAAILSPTSWALRAHLRKGRCLDRARDRHMAPGCSGLLLFSDEVEGEDGADEGLALRRAQGGNELD